MYMYICIYIYIYIYRVVPGDRNWHIETADCNLAGFFTIFRSPGMGEGGDWWS